VGSVRRRGAQKLGELRRKVEVSRSTNEHNIVLTGPGRSGTTLTCHLLNKLPDTVALAEPLSPNRFVDRMPDYDAVCDELEKIYLRMRRRALQEGVVKGKHVGASCRTTPRGRSTASASA
jgi:hypothetical protein